MQEEIDVVEIRPVSWVPDENLRDAAEAGRVRIGDLKPADRAYLIAVLTFSGYTTDRIAEWLHCSRRRVQQVRAEPMAVVVSKLLRAEHEKDATLRKARTGVAQVSVSQLTDEIVRLKESRATVIEQMRKMRERCGQPTVIVMHTGRRRRCQSVDHTLPLFEVGV